MSTNIQKKLIWWWGWKPEPLEDTLEAMAKHGWVIENVNALGIYFTFRKGSSRTLRFATDYQPEASKDYLELFQSDGWSLEWSGAGGWYLFSKPYDTVRPDIFSDNTSLIERNNRILKVLLPIFIMLVVLFFSVVLPVLKEPFYIVLYILVISLYSYIFSQIWRYNRKLKLGI